MRNYRKDVCQAPPGNLPDDEQKKSEKPLTAAQKRKIEALKKRLAENNRARFQGAAVTVVPNNAEIRGN